MSPNRTIVSAGIWLLVIALIAPRAIAHDWYPRECCSAVDCAPVERVERLPDGSQRLTSRVGTTLVPASFPRQPSPDGQMHICMVRYSHLDDMKPVCLFVPFDAVPQPS